MHVPVSYILIFERDRESFAFDVLDRGLPFKDRKFFLHYSFVLFFLSFRCMLFFSRRRALMHVDEKSIYLFCPESGISIKFFFSF